MNPMNHTCRAQGLTIMWTALRFVKGRSVATKNSRPTGGIADAIVYSHPFPSPRAMKIVTLIKARSTMSKQKYHFILNEIGLCTGARRVDGRALLNFMFYTNEVTEEVAEKSESLLTKLMQDDREWIWVAVDSDKDPHVVDKKMIGAMGYSPDDPFDRVTVDLRKVHKRWRKRNDGGIHPLTTIVEVWIADGKDQGGVEERRALP